MYARHWFTLTGMVVFSQLVLTAGAAAETTPPPAPRVDFSYAFAVPHRVTVGRPDRSERTIVDAEPGSLKLLWTYENLTRDPLAAYMPRTAQWPVRVQPLVSSSPNGTDRKPLPQSTWTRLEGFLPALDNTYRGPSGSVRLEVVGGMTATLVRITLSNSGTTPLRYDLVCDCQRGFYGYNPAHIDAARDRDCLLAGWGDRADRVVICGVGADEYPVDTALNNAASVRMTMSWKVQPGQTRTSWLIRPYASYAADLPALRTRDWAQELDQGIGEWRTLLGRATRIAIPDAGVQKAYYACLSDLFIMREPVADGYVAAVPGTDCYRATNPGEAAIVSVALDQAGLHREAVNGYQMCIDQQGPNGDWADPQGWCHLMWCISGFKCWAIMEHYRMTRDRDYLQKNYPRMLASSGFQESMRARTRTLVDGKKPLTYGLMPPGMGDCGLKNDDSLYGVFLPHNIWAVYADRCSVEAAEILDRQSDLPELRKIAQTATTDLLDALNRGAISEKGYRWIPGVPGKTCGSRWGVLNALFPCRLLPADHELISGTMRHIGSRMSPGGLHVNTGWLTNGMWVAISLDNLAECHLVRHEADTAVALLYATLNHGTPLYTWCEERGQPPHSPQITGDRQHLWTPVAVVRAIRDYLIMEQQDGLHLALATALQWLSTGQPVGVTDAPTHYGRVSYSIRFSPDQKRINGEVVFPDKASIPKATLHVRLPGGLKLTSVQPASGAAIVAGGRALEWKSPQGRCVIEADVK